ncbi:MAG TPA: hypothetical protein QGF58_19645 [Myxococcota bacterium]|nr:hypothetical protein [Myxococcota bacterium]
MQGTRAQQGLRRLCGALLVHAAVEVLIWREPEDGPVQTVFVERDGLQILARAIDLRTIRVRARRIDDPPGNEDHLFDTVVPEWPGQRESWANRQAMLMVRFVSRD